MFRDGLAACNVKEMFEQLVTGIDPVTRTAQLAAARRCSTTCSSASSVHRAPQRSLTRASSSTIGCRSTSPTRTPFPGVYALGDVCTGPRTVPKAGIFAEAPRVVADAIAATTVGAEPPAPWPRRRASATPRPGGGLVSKVEGQLPQRRCANGPAPRTSPRGSPPRRRVRRHPAGSLVRSLLKTHDKYQPLCRPFRQARRPGCAKRPALPRDACKDAVSGRGHWLDTTRDQAHVEPAQATNAPPACFAHRLRSGCGGARERGVE